MTSEAGGSDVPPASFHLRELNSQSAKVGHWIVKVHKADINEYEYMYQGQTRRGRRMDAVLISADASWYCLGCVKANKQAPMSVDQAAQQFKVDTMWRLTHVNFTDDNKSYVNTPFKHVIDMGKSKMTAVLNSLYVMPKAPAPPATLAEILQITNSQRFDVTGVVVSTTQPKFVDTKQGHRAVIDVTVVDQSLTAAGKMASMTFPIFWVAQKSAEEPHDMKTFQAAAEKHPMSFFGMYASSKVGQQIEIATSKVFYWAVAAGVKAENLSAQMATLKGMPEDATQRLNRAWEPQDSKDYLACPCTQATCALLDCMQGPNSKYVDGSVLQLNYIEVQPPLPGSSVLMPDGSRIWFTTIIADFTGGIEVGIREKAALSLAGLDPKDPESRNQFVQKAQGQDLQFPILSSIRVLVSRRPLDNVDSTVHTPTSQALYSGPEAGQLRMVVVEAVEQGISAAPTQAMMDLLPFLKEILPPTTGLVPAVLSSLKASAHYPITISAPDGSTLDRHCDKALVMLTSRRRSTCQALESGFRVLTAGLRDALAETDPAEYNAVATCTTVNVTDFKLDPPRGTNKEQHALAVVCGVDPGSKTLYLQSLCLLKEDEKGTAIKMMKELLYITHRTAFEGTAKRPFWDTPDKTPVDSVRKCRRLGACPTDSSLPESS